MTLNTQTAVTNMTVAWYTVVADVIDKTPYDTKQALEEILNLPFDRSTNPNRYLIDSTNKALYMDYPQHSNQLGKAFTFHRVVRDKLPEIDNDGARRDLALGPTEGLVHTAVGLLLEDNLLGLAFASSFQPSTKQIAHYLGDKRSSSGMRPTILPLVHQDTFGRLLTSGELIKATLLVEAGAADLLRQTGHELMRTMDDALELEPTTREIPMAWSPSDTNGFAERISRRFSTLLDISGARRHVKQMKGIAVSENERKRITIDMLSDKLTESIEVTNPNPQSARIEIPEAIEALHESYSRLSNDIESSIGAQLSVALESERQLRFGTIL